MTKRKTRRVFLWLHRPKKPKNARASTVHPRTGAVYNVLSPYKTPTFTPRKTTSNKRLLTPKSTQRKSNKKMKTFISPSKARQETLDEHVIIDEMEEEITPEAKAFIDIASDSDVIDIISKAGYLCYLTSFFKLVKERKYPMTNIVFLLWMETIRWFSCATSLNMWYWKETKKFWRAGYRLFRGKFLTFMSGPRYAGLTVSRETNRNTLTPDKSEINFAVPCRAVLLKNNDSNIPSIIKPGIICNTLQAVASSTLNKVNMMCVDGKKVNAGLDANDGDVNMFGFENSPTVDEHKQRLSSEIEMIQDMRDTLSDMETDSSDQGNRADRIFNFIGMIRTLIYLLTLRLRDGRNLKSKQEYGLEKLKERAGPDWKSSKYLYAISSMQAFLFRVKQFIDTTLCNITKLCRLGSALNNSSANFCSGDFLDAITQKNLFVLKDTKEQTQPVPTNLIKQRSDMWHAVRKMTPVTGSTLHNAIGLRSLKEQKLHFDHNVLGLEAPVPSEEVQKYLDHGTKNEPNAIATLAGRYLPMFYPELSVVEEGCYLIAGNAGQPLIEVSPDGSLRRVPQGSDKKSGGVSESEVIAAIEIKCPYPKSKNNPLYYEIPDYYICQCLAEMRALCVSMLLFVCYTEESATFFELDFNESLWESIEHEVEELYGPDKQSRPTKLRPGAKSLREKIKTYKTNHVRLLGEVPSIKMQNEAEFVVDDSEPYYRTTSRQFQNTDLTNVLDELQVTLNESEESIKSGHQLSRRKATEVMVWVISNKDRQWSNDLPNSVPVAYGLKDYKLSSDKLREASNYVLGECVKHGLKIPLLAFDGQWYSLMVRDNDQRPLTKLQLQKDVWGKVVKMNKTQIADSIKQLNTVNVNGEADDYEGIEVRKEGNGLFVSASGHAFQTIRTNYDKKYWKRNDKSEKEEETDVEENVINDSVYEWIPASVIQTIESNGDKELISAINGLSKDVDELIRKGCQSSSNEDEELHAETVDENTERMTNSEIEMVSEQTRSVDHIDETNRDEEIESMVTECERIAVGSVQNVQRHEEEVSNEQNNTTLSILIDENGNEGDNRQKVSVYEIQESDCKAILTQFKNSKRPGKWAKTTANDLKECLKNAESLKAFFHDELDIIVSILQEKTEFDYGKRWKKDRKINVISRLVGDGSTIQPKKRKRIFHASSLKNLAVKVLKSKRMPKTILNIAYSQYLFPTDLAQWRSKSPVCSTFHHAEEEIEIDWYSHPEINPATEEILCKCLDSHHLLTNLRVKTCTTGLKDISPDAWKKVARSYKTKLTPAMVDDIVDKQSNAFAQTHFSETVESEMERNGDLKEAEFCRLIRRWYEAEDMAALSVNERLTRWLELRNYLLDEVDFGKFPPPGQFVKGFSTISFEGLLCGIDTKLQLYGLCGPYCVRTASSLPAETCVGGIQDLNINSSMNVNAKDIPKIMSCLTEIMTYKCDPNRGFHMKTSRAPVYPVVGGKGSSPASCNTTDEQKVTYIGSLAPRNHLFDQPERRRTKVRRKLGALTDDLDKPPKGTRRLRDEFHKCNESKVLPSGRAGNFEDDVSFQDMTEL